MAASKLTNLQLNTTIPTVGASLLAMTARQPTHYLQTACIPCGSWFASDGGLAADHFLIELSDRRLQSLELKSEVKDRSLRQLLQGLQGDSLF